MGESSESELGCVCFGEAIGISVDEAVDGEAARGGAQEVVPQFSEVRDFFVVDLN